VGLSLVPEGGRGDVVLEGEIARFVADARAPAKGLDGDAEVLFEDELPRPSHHTPICSVPVLFNGFHAIARVLRMTD
jgi:hypothetical protein